MTIEEKRRALEAYGFVIGPRDTRLNRRYPGAFMVADSYEDSETPTEDGSNGPWCIVGDDLGDLITTAFSVWAEDIGHPQPEADK
jgi:hypothetical protein